MCDEYLRTLARFLVEGFQANHLIMWKELQHIAQSRTDASETVNNIESLNFMAQRGKRTFGLACWINRQNTSGGMYIPSKGYAHDRMELPVDAMAHPYKPSQQGKKRSDKLGKIVEDKPPE